MVIRHAGVRRGTQEYAASLSSKAMTYKRNRVLSKSIGFVIAIILGLSSNLVNAQDSSTTSCLLKFSEPLVQVSSQGKAVFSVVLEYGQAGDELPQIDGLQFDIEAPTGYEFESITPAASMPKGALKIVQKSPTLATFVYVAKTKAQKLSNSLSIALADVQIDAVTDLVALPPYSVFSFATGPGFDPAIVVSGKKIEIAHSTSLV